MLMAGEGPTSGQQAGPGWPRAVAKEHVGEGLPLTGPIFLASLVRELAGALDVPYVFVAEATGTGGLARTLAVCAHGQIAPNVEYPLQQMPCREVAAGGTVCYPRGVRLHFTPGPIVGESDLESYLGVSLRGEGRPAWIALMDTKPLADPGRAEKMLLSHADLASAELHQLRAEEALRETRGRLEILAEMRSGELRAANQRLELETALRRRAEDALRVSEEKFSKTFRSSPGCVTISTFGEGRFLEINETFLRVGGFTREEVVGRTGLELALWAEPMEWERLRRLLQVEGTLRNKEYVLRTKSGDRRVMLTSAETIDLGGEACVLAVEIDITERKRAEAALRASEERYALASRGANDGLWDWDLVGGDVYFSPRWKEMLGPGEAEISTHPSEWFRRTHPEDRDRLSMEIVSHLEGMNAHFESEHRVLHQDGTYRWMLCRGLAVRDEFGRATRLAGSLTDITRHKAMEEQLIHDAFHDLLTGLPNRALFMDRLDRVVERAKRHAKDGFAVLFLDLDRFKVINDSLGHTVGDELLVGIARRLSAVLRPEDTVARLGGDEFAVLLEDVGGVSDATRVAGRIGEELRRSFAVGQQEVFTTASIGIAVSATGYDRPADVLRDADTALYRAKAQGRARYEVFDRTMHLRAVARLQIETDLRRAVERGEFALCYQPIISLPMGDLAGFEALVRWNHPTRGRVPPAEFIAVAEETGLIVPLGNWVLREACRQGREWQDRLGPGRALSISVNLSARQLAQGDLVEQVRDVLAETGMKGDCLRLEITETVIMENADAAAAMLARLKELGVRVSVDDFGMGYSCLSLLHRFPIDTLKIDRSFVGLMGPKGEGGATVRTIVALAHNLSMDVIAEGVETQAQLSSLRELDCGYAQGYLISEPLDPEKAETLLGKAAAGTGLLGAGPDEPPLAGLVPICAWCKKVRDERGEWREAALPVLGAENLTHGICPECLRKQAPPSPE
jgi:diguanylate cyclase (GGDEF)-like protein/PAS domain S-box-containing protein